MRFSSTALLIPFLEVGSAVTRSTTTPNLVAGTWTMLSASQTTNGVVTPGIWGPAPHGLLIFSPTLHFIVQVNFSNLSQIHFASDSDRTSGTDEQNAAVMAGSLALSGTYEVDDDGVFESQVVQGSTFPNWIGLRRNRSEITETVGKHGRRMFERLVVDETSFVEITWGKISSTET